MVINSVCQTLCLYAAAKDAESVKIEQMLSENGIKSYPFPAATMTTKKQRVLAFGRQLCRIDSEKPLTLTKQQEDKIIYQATSLYPRVNLVLISDYDKGLITPRIAQALIQEANKQHKPILIDPKGDNYFKYAGATLVKPNLEKLKTAIRQIAPNIVGLNQLDPAHPEDIEKIKQLAILFKDNLN